MNLIFAFILLALALGAMVVRKTYYSLPAAELKRMAELHDPIAVVLYRAVAYDSSLRALLWILIGLLGGSSLILLARNLPIWVSLLIAGPLLWIALSWLPASRVSKVSIRLTTLVTPMFAWLLNWLHPILSRSANVIEKRATIAKHTGLFEKADLLDVIDQQQYQTNSRITDEELVIVRHALTFGDYKVSDILTPRKTIKTVYADDTVGPILIDELHQSGQNLVLVRNGKKGSIVGSLDFHALDIHSKGHVRDLMNKAVYYVHENDSLSEALHAFFETNHALFVVVNSFEEYLGVITVENIIKQLLGHVPGEDFDQYSDLNAVASRHTTETAIATPENVLE